MTSAAKPVIELEHVSFSYTGTPVVDRIDLVVERGEFLGIVGPNAGGKSTLLKLILGLLKPHSGRIRVLGREPVQAQRAIGYVPQYPSFPRDFPINVEQAVLLGRLGTGPLIGGFRRADRIAVQRALSDVEADTLARLPIRTLSGGQLQRVLLARALVSDPEILILDEPTANIDQRLEYDIFAKLRELQAHKTILVVSHDIGFISGYVNRVACINRTLVCHQTDAIDGRVISEMYGDNVRMVAHRH
ncbi:MAG: ABC transporter ATP-binding protein [Gammaproteobacteria bacterium]|nr:ABC transporter ATP-binding protein [Gammaproteobacteria bacterium]